jgi:hypothetical protein
MKFPTSRAKLARAEQHRLSITPEIIEYATSNRIHFARKDNLGQVKDRTIRCEYTVSKLEEPPESWPHVAGDAIQNTRAALDHAIWALVVKRKGAKFAHDNRQRIVFPIRDKPENFPEATLAKWGLKPTVIDVIRDSQPFSAGVDPHVHALWFLRELSNIDKHQMLHVIVLIPEEVFLNTDPPIPGGRLTIDTRGPLYKGAPAITFTAPRPAHVRGRVKVDLQFNAGFCFDQTPTTKPTSIDVALQAMHNEAAHVIGQLEVAATPPRRRKMR